MGRLYRDPATAEATFGGRIRAYLQQQTPSTDLLMWSPPTLTSPTTINVTEGGSRYFETTDDNEDFIVNLPATPLGVNTDAGMPVLWLVGGRNYRLIGGEIYLPDNLEPPQTNTNGRGIVLSGINGTVHIEGVWIHGDGCSNGVSFDNGRGHNSTGQIQNCRIESLHPLWHTPGDPVEVHPDALQSWQGPETLRLYQLTLISNGTSMLWQPSLYDSTQPMGTWDYRKINMVHQTTLGYGLWKDADAGDFWSEYHEDNWYRPDPAHGNDNSSWGNGNCYACWNPPGSGGWTITGEAFNLGYRSTDFVTSSDCGIGYVSPGYQ